VRTRQPCWSYLDRLHRAHARRESANAAVVSLVAIDGAPTSSTPTVQNWYHGRCLMAWLIYNFFRSAAGAVAATRTSPGPRSILLGDHLEIHGLRTAGRGLDRRFYSWRPFQEIPTICRHRTKIVVHIGPNTAHRSAREGISAGHVHKTYRGLCKIRCELPWRPYSHSVDSLLDCGKLRCQHSVVE